MFTGAIGAAGPRYCPSIEDKIVRFADKGSHQIFIEPEGLNTHEVYPNGISTSLPFDVQFEFVRSMKGYGYPDYIRVNVGTPEENQRFIEALKVVLDR